MQPTPRASMPSLARVEAHWELLGPTALQEVFPDNRAFGIGWGEPFCFRCGWLAPIDDYPLVRDRMRATGKLRELDERQVINKVTDRLWNDAGGWLQRAHLWDHSEGGDESPDNLVPLCLACHRHMPACRSRQDGVDYVNQDVTVPWPLQMATDYLCKKRNATKQEKERRYWRAVGYFHEMSAQVAVELAEAGEPVPIPPAAQRSWPRGFIPGHEAEAGAGLVTQSHWNKRHWNTVTLDGSLRERMVTDLVEDSYDLVVSGLSRTRQRALRWSPARER